MLVTSSILQSTTVVVARAMPMKVTSTKLMVAFKDYCPLAAEVLETAMELAKGKSAPETTMTMRKTSLHPILSLKVFLKIP